ncbi:LytTR family DNA-binding domain-containing protein [Pedobacter antarcticus]|uniref:LytR/AlgR family response regulator transcription factor n=1 Tax=Pedobacter antarcticus TaxID=34086 RepID=UPI00292CE17D|nr:LytTR family DNA-binding domain-containing protein [Pedobacter antarcticus]
MRILIIEDEVKTAKSLARLIQSIDIRYSIADSLQSISSAVKWFSDNEQPDVIFMDIQLADGLSFDIFTKVNITAPVIFCTAFDDYSIQAFKSNGIEYLLKPFNRNDIESAFDKITNLKTHFNRDQSTSANLLNILKSISEDDTKKNFLVYNRNSYINVSTSVISYFYKSLNGINLVTDDKKTYSLTESLDQLHRMVGKHSFYRINRQYLVAFKSITEVQHYFDRKLVVRLNIETDEKLIVGRERASEFLDWLGDR